MIVKRISAAVLAWLAVSLASAASAGCDSADDWMQQQYLRSIETHRQITDQAFRDPSTSPLLPADLAGFDGLDYYPVDGCYALAAEFHPADGSRSYELPTSDGGSQKFVEFGRLSFSAQDGASAELLLFQRADLGAFGELTAIAPFRDQTNGSGTYSGGRYLKFLLPLTEPLRVDFNRAVNPACAYNPSFPCPIPPKANWLPFAVPAGERAFISGSP